MFTKKIREKKITVELKKMPLFTVNSLLKGWKRHKVEREREVACEGTECRKQTGKGETDLYMSGNKGEKVIYLTLICCSGSRACPVSLLLTFKPEYTHK